MPNRHAAFLTLFFLIAIGALGAEAKELKVETPGSEPGASYVFFGPDGSVNDFSQAIEVCPTTTLTFDRSRTGTARVFATNPSDDTAAEILARPVVATLSSDISSSISLPSATNQLRVLVDTVETGSPDSIVRFFCSKSGNDGSGVPGLTGNVGNEETLSYLYQLKNFQAVSEQITATVYVDPLNGSDSTGNGSYELPYFSFAKIKEQCLRVPRSRCVVKGRNRWFTHTLLTLSYTAGRRPLMVGETVTFATPTGSAEVLAVDGNNAVVTWISGADPRDHGATTFTAGGGESSGDVTLVRDSINGLPARQILNADITTATDVIASAGHSYTVNGSGPFLFYSSDDDITYSANAITQNVTPVYICTIVASTSFQLSTNSACSQIVNFNSKGAGTAQIIAGGGLSGMRNSINVSCPDNDRFCVLFTSEFADSPWGLDSGSLAGDGALWNETEFDRWVNAGGYYTPYGGMFIAIDSTSPDPLANGWIGVENGVIQNMADDCFYTGDAGKIVTLNVRCKIKNGVGDRSQNGGTPPGTAHASVVSTSGFSTPNPTWAGAALIMLNADGSQSQMGSNLGSGGLFNPNERGVLRVISDGYFRYDGISGDTSCSGAPCSTHIGVIAGGDTVIIGPHLRIGGTTTNAEGFAVTGTVGRLGLYKTVVEMNNVLGSATGLGDPAIFDIAGGAQGITKTIDLKNVTIVRKGPQMLAVICPLQGTTAATANSRLDVRMENVLFEGTNSANADWLFSISDCGLSGSGYSPADAVARTTFKVRGVRDQDDPRSGLSNYFYSPSARALGSCGAANTFLNDVCTAVDAAGNNTPDDAWDFFTVNSADSGGVGVNGSQWTSGDPQFRCASGKECYGTSLANPTTYNVSLRDSFSDSRIGCIPKDVVGVEICGFNLSSLNIGAR